MNWIDRLLSALFPTFLLEGTPWISTWEEKERREFIRFSRVVFLLAAAAFIANYVFFDRVVGLQPPQFWLWFRASMSAVSLLCAAFYFSPLANSFRFYKLPAFVAGAIYCYFQGRVLVWYEPSVYPYAFAFVVLCTTFMRTTMLYSWLYVSLLLGLMFPSFVEAGVSMPLFYSGSIVSLVAISFIRSSYGSEVAYFISQQSNIESQKRIVELTTEFSDRIRTFLPKEITRRIDEHIRSRHMTILQASEQVLRPRKAAISCLFSDIRGFTTSTRNVEGFVVDGVIPNVKECTRVVEDQGGVPRKIGDLIFAYFDRADSVDSLSRCVLAAIAMIDTNRLSNKMAGKNPIRRNVLVASGEAVVGNLGGFDSSIEITALGDPVNFLARLDEATKNPAISSRIVQDVVVMDTASARMLLAMHPGLVLEELKLKQLGVSIRDFADVSSIYLLPLSSENRTEFGISTDAGLEAEMAQNWDIGYENAAS